MQICATFTHSAFLELAISELSETGINDIFAIPLNPRQIKPRMLDSIHRADGISFIDVGMILAFMFGTIGASKGFVWKLGPIYCGLLGAAIGFLLGVTLKIGSYLLSKRSVRVKEAQSEVILIVTCEESQAALVEDILWDHYALGLAKIE
jgi:hypothetical protein